MVQIAGVGSFTISDVDAQLRAALELQRQRQANFRQMRQIVANMAATDAELGLRRQALGLERELGQAQLGIQRESLDIRRQELKQRGLLGKASLGIQAFTAESLAGLRKAQEERIRALTPEEVKQLEISSKYTGALIDRVEAETRKIDQEVSTMSELDPLKLKEVDLRIRTLEDNLAVLGETRDARVETTKQALERIKEEVKTMRSERLFKYGGEAAGTEAPGGAASIDEIGRTVPPVVQATTKGVLDDLVKDLGEEGLLAASGRDSLGEVEKMVQRIAQDELQTGRPPTVTSVKQAMIKELSNRQGLEALKEKPGAERAVRAKEEFQTIRRAAGAPDIGEELDQAAQATSEKLEPGGASLDFGTLIDTGRLFSAYQAVKKVYSANAKLYGEEGLKATLKDRIVQSLKGKVKRSEDGGVMIFGGPDLRSMVTGGTGLPGWRKLEGSDLIAFARLLEFLGIEDVEVFGYR